MFDTGKHASKRVGATNPNGSVANLSSQQKPDLVTKKQKKKQV